MLSPPSGFQECKEEYRLRRPTHMACRPPNNNCNIAKRGVSSSDRLLILKTHNDFRSMVALGKLKGFPPAADMRKREWDAELASVAQENEWSGRVREWFIEHADFSPERRQSFRVLAQDRRKPTGHFSQLVCAETSYVGCGFVEYSVANATRLPCMQYYVCNYAVTGNVFKRPLYREGEPCTACPAGTVCEKAVITEKLIDKYLAATDDPVPPQFPDYEGRDAPSMDEDFTVAEVKRVLASLNSRSAPGPDGVTNKMLKHLDDDSIEFLTDKINEIWRSGLIPKSWKAACTDGAEADNAGIGLDFTVSCLIKMG
ncbi:CRISP/Allergen/PR-1 [Rhipicephalus microplus]|uniref:CRISP/Allergen/PR-1 n=1 Tax=Rhipicephalus microplus TaxID=6941 RepID=UPI003F6D068F